MMYYRLFTALLFTTLMSIGCSSSATAQELSMNEQELQAMQQELSAKQSLIVELNTAKQIDDFLSLFVLNEQTYLMHLWLLQLSQQDELSLEHRQWVEKLSTQNKMISVNYADHPNKAIQVVDIAANAKAALKIISLKLSSKEIAKNWEGGAFDWQDYLEKDAYRSLLMWVNQQEDASNIAWHFLRHIDTHQLPDNHLLSLLISHSASEPLRNELLSLLFTRPVDEFTYQITQTLPDMTKQDDGFAIKHLAVATNVEKLSSQAFLILAKRFPKNEQAQAVIENGLFSKNTQWHAAMALSQMDAPDFKQRILLRMDKAGLNTPTAMRKLVMQNNGSDL